MPSLCSKTTSFFLHVHTYGCPLEHQDVSLFSVVSTFESFSRLMFWACLISPFTCCITCCHCALKQFLHLHTYGCPLENQDVSLFSVVSTFESFSRLMFWACLISPFTCCITCCHCALKQFLHLHTYGCPLEHQPVSFISVVSTFECFSCFTFWACLISPFNCCVICHHCALKQLLFSCMYIPMAVHWNFSL